MHFTFKAQERKVKLEEKRRKLAAAAALLEGRNADGLVSDSSPLRSDSFLCSTLLLSASASSSCPGSAYQADAITTHSHRGTIMND